MALAIVTDTGAAELTPAVRRVLLATDLGPVSSAAESAAIDLAAAASASLVILSVIEPARLRLPGGLFVQRVDQVRGTREVRASALAERARMAGIPVQFLIWEGDPAESILEVAVAEEVDAVVMGSHSRGRLGRLLLGSVSSRVVEGARCQVYIARGDELVRHEAHHGDPAPADVPDREPDPRRQPDGSRP
jgi:nucleotide-binding universal stress UspA family protein